MRRTPKANETIFNRTIYPIAAIRKLVLNGLDIAEERDDNREARPRNPATGRFTSPRDTDLDEVEATVGGVFPDDEAGADEATATDRYRTANQHHHYVFKGAMVPNCQLVAAAQVSDEMVLGYGDGEDEVEDDTDDNSGYLAYMEDLEYVAATRAHMAAFPVLVPISVCTAVDDEVEVETNDGSLDDFSDERCADAGEDEMPNLHPAYQSPVPGERGSHNRRQHRRLWKHCYGRGLSRQWARRATNPSFRETSELWTNDTAFNDITVEELAELDAEREESLREEYLLDYCDWYESILLERAVQLKLAA